MAADRCGLIDDQGFWDAIDKMIARASVQRIIPGTRP